MQPATLSLFPELPPISRPDPDAQAVRRRDGVDYYELAVRRILHRTKAGARPFSRTLNPYRGCEFGYAFSYARYTHGFFELDLRRDLERKVFVKRNAARLLERELRRCDLRGERIAIGTVSDPYPPAERLYRVTQSVLETFERAEGLDISITTRSPLILRDLELLTRLDVRHSVTVNISIATLDPATARTTEPRAPAPEARLRAVRKLSAEGLATRVFCMPILPGINSTEGQLRPLFEAAVEHEAEDVIGDPLVLRPGGRKRFWPWLESKYPQLVPRYQALYGDADSLSGFRKERLMAPFEALRLAYGFPRRTAGRG